MKSSKYSFTMTHGMQSTVYFAEYSFASVHIARSSITKSHALPLEKLLSKVHCGFFAGKAGQKGVFSDLWRAAP